LENGNCHSACTCQPWGAVQGGAGTGEPERSEGEESLFFVVEIRRLRYQRNRQVVLQEGINKVALNLTGCGLLTCYAHSLTRTV